MIQAVYVDGRWVRSSSSVLRRQTVDDALLYLIRVAACRNVRRFHCLARMYIYICIYWEHNNDENLRTSRATSSMDCRRKLFWRRTNTTQRARDLCVSCVMSGVVFVVRETRWCGWRAMCPLLRELQQQKTRQTTSQSADELHHWPSVALSEPTWNMKHTIEKTCECSRSNISNQLVEICVCSFSTGKVFYLQCGF